MYGTEHLLARAVEREKGNLQKDQWDAPGEPPKRREAGTQNRGTIPAIARDHTTRTLRYLPAAVPVVAWASYRKAIFSSSASMLRPDSKIASTAGCPSPSVCMTSTRVPS